MIPLGPAETTAGIKLISLIKILSVQQTSECVFLISTVKFTHAVQRTFRTKY